MARTSCDLVLLKLGLGFEKRLHNLGQSLWPPRAGSPTLYATYNYQLT
jgi:hypothetical protein